MKRKLSNKAKINISNAQHLRLRDKYNLIFKTTHNEAEKKKAWVKKEYHDAIYFRQGYDACLLSKSAKNYFYTLYEKLCEKEKYRFR